MVGVLIKGLREENGEKDLWDDIGGKVDDGNFLSHTQQQHIISHAHISTWEEER